MNIFLLSISRLLSILLLSLVLTLACDDSVGDDGSSGKDGSDIIDLRIPQDALDNGRVYYVTNKNQDKAPVDNGKSWSTSYGKKQLQLAIDAAASGDGGSNQYYVAVQQGTYTPGTEKTDSFKMKNKVTIVGGFLGTEINGDPIGETTVLSGDLDDNDDIEFNDDGSITITNMSNNVTHVFYHATTANLNNTAVIRNVTITGGNVTGDSYGGGMCNENSSPTLEYCNFIRNHATGGGGIGNNFNSAPKMINCKFENNTAFVGGAAYNEQSSSIIINCDFIKNDAYYFGGGTYETLSSSSTITKCNFIGNVVSSEKGNGGGICIVGSSATITASSFTENTAPEGGAIFGAHSIIWKKPESTFTNNKATISSATNNFYPADYKIIYTP